MYFRHLVLAALLLFSLSSFATELSPMPKLDIGKGGKCVDDPAYMRKNHMNLLKHQRDETMREGIRGGKYSLKSCVECHASSQNNSVLGSNKNFCQGCHVYAGVKLDCFECHASKPKSTAFHPLTANHAGETARLVSLLRMNLTHKGVQP